MSLKNPHAWLQQELPKWISEGIVDTTQAQKIQALYPEQQSIGWGRILVSAFGAVMIGLGVVLLFAYNWDEISRLGKMAIILSTLVVTHWFAYRTRIKQRHGLSESLFILATMLFGAGIWLVAQVYHLDEHYPNAFLLWGTGSLLLAWALPSLPQAILTLALFTTWHLTQVMDFEFATHEALLLLVLGVFPLVWRLRSPVLAKLAATTFFVSLGLTTASVNEHLFGSVLLIAAVIFIFTAVITARSHDHQLQMIGSSLASPAYLVLVVILILMTFGDIANDLIRVSFDSPTEYWYFYGAFILSQALFVLIVLRKQLNLLVVSIELALLLGVYPSLFNIGAIPLLYNLLLLVMATGLIYEGSHQHNTRKMMQGSIILSVLVLARFSDMFDSLIARALAFFIVGLMLFVAGHAFNRKRKAD